MLGSSELTNATILKHQTGSPANILVDAVYQCWPVPPPLGGPVALGTPGPLEKDCWP